MHATHAKHQGAKLESLETRMFISQIGWAKRLLGIYIGEEGITSKRVGSTAGK